MRKADTQLTIYAATKKATESMDILCASVEPADNDVPVLHCYGTWGRPDLALFQIRWMQF